VTHQHDPFRRSDCDTCLAYWRAMPWDVLVDAWMARADRLLTDESWRRIDAALSRPLARTAA
jgi:hypothetical protein